MQYIQETRTRDVYRIQVAFSVSILGVTIQYDGHSLHDFSADLEFIVVVMPYTSLRRSTSWSVVGNGSEDSFRLARDPPRCTGAQSQASAGLLSRYNGSHFQEVSNGACYGSQARSL
jgi:hypothetical protein